VEPGLGECREVGAFWRVLAEEAVRVFVRAALPGALRIAAVDGDVGGDGEACVLGHLHSAVPGERAARLPREPMDLSAERTGDRAGVLPVDGDEHREARVP